MNGEQRPTRSGAPSTAGTSTRQQQAEGQLRALELFGMRFGLDRMRRMMTVLGSPERSFEAVHVLGTNGKSSTTRMTAAILERHGLRTGAYLSPTWSPTASGCWWKSARWTPTDSPTPSRGPPGRPSGSTAPSPATTT